jgi:MFS transporter, PPP family, 3-phenylpropionic acid transporter
MRKIWPFSFSFLIFAGFAFIAPFMVLYYQSLGFTGTQIGLLTGLTPLITLFSAPFWTGLADTRHRHRLIMGLTLLTGAITIFLYPFFTTFAPILLLAVLFNTFFAPVTSFADSATLFMLGNRKEMYGRIRLGGTIGFGVAAFLAGALIQNYGLKVAFWGGAALFFLALIVSQKFVHSPLHNGSSNGGGVRTLLRERRWFFFLVLAFAGGLGMAAANNYLFSFLKELGANETTMGFTLTLGTVSEMPVLFFGNRLIQRFRANGLLLLATVVTGFRFLLYAGSGTPDLILILQLLNGLTFPAMWIAGVAYADENAPGELSATAQGLFSAMVFGFGSAVGGFIGGPLIESMGGRGMYLVFGLIILCVAALVAFFQKRLTTK